MTALEFAPERTWLSLVWPSETAHANRQHARSQVHPFAARRGGRVRRREGDHHRPQRPACCEVGGNQASPDRQADRGVAKGKFVVPDTIDTDDEAAITALFTGKPE
jgi:hypothetical protein